LFEFAPRRDIAWRLRAALTEQIPYFVLPMLVDTNVVSELMRPRPSSRVLTWAKGQQRFQLSVVSLEEITFGLAARPNTRVEEWFQTFVGEHCDVMDVTAAIARRCGRIRAELRSRGAQRTQADMLIAATASEHGLVLVTRNVRDFDGCGIALLNPFAEQ
jgi:predicted nucleic acid-binding protein